MNKGTVKAGANAPAFTVRPGERLCASARRCYGCTRSVSQPPYLTLTVEMAAGESTEPSLTTKVTLRSPFVGLAEVLL